MTSATLAILAELTAHDRWAAARSGSSPLTSWTVWLPVAMATLLGIALVWAYRRWSTRREMLQSFYTTADRLGLTKTERAALKRIAELAEVKRFGSVYTMEEAFERGLDRLLTGEPIASMDAEQQARVVTVIEQLRTKLGFWVSEDGEDGSEAVARLDEGDRVQIIRRPDQTDVETAILSVRGRELTVAADPETGFQLGEACLVRCVRHGLQWEYSASVVRVPEGEVVVRRIGLPRCIELRRFLRVPTRREAYVARFPFLHVDPAEDLPQFAPGMLTEIAGPGLRIETNLKAEQGDRVLVILKLDAGKVVQTTGKVRRAVADEDEPAALIIEARPQSDAEMGELVRETNAAARAGDTTAEAELAAAPA